jgi:hypothetical protein
MTASAITRTGTAKHSTSPTENGALPQSLPRLPWITGYTAWLYHSANPGTSLAAPDRMTEQAMRMQLIINIPFLLFLLSMF